MLPVAAALRAGLAAGHRGDARASRSSAGPDPQAHLDAVEPYVDAGFDELYVANMGPHYRDMIEFYGKEILPVLG